MTYQSAMMDALVHEIEHQAIRTAANIVKSRASRYRFRPQYLYALCRDLPSYTPERMIRCVKALAEYEASTPRRWAGFGGEDVLANCRGALIYARYLRAKEHHQRTP